MHENTGLADQVAYNDVINGNLREFFEKYHDKVEIIQVPDNVDYKDFLKTHLKSSYKSVVIFYGTETLNQLKSWTKYFPNIQPFYAVKCNPNEHLMNLMATFPGICFDCASSEEIIICISRGIPACRLIFANPTKSEENIKFMADNNVWCGTLDCREEVEKIHSVLGDRASNCKIVIRLAVADGGIVPLSSKYGAKMNEVPGIMEACKKYNMQVVGVAFHVGSGNQDETAHQKALELTKEVFDLGAEYGFKMNLVDFGGGWSGELCDSELNNPGLERVSKNIYKALDELGFNQIEDIKYISEPGRYFNSDVIDVACFITCVQERDGRRIYTINEGVMGIFKDIILTDELTFGISALSEGECVPSSLIGPSGLDIDVVCEDVMLPRLQVGDPILIRAIGAYTVSLTTLPLRHNQRFCFLVRESSVKSM